MHILHQSNRPAGTTCPTYIFIIWKEDASLPAMFNPLCSSTNQHLLKKNLCNQSSHYENYGQFNGSHHVPTTKLTLSWWTKMNGIQRRVMVSPWRMHCMYSGMEKGISQAEATSNSEIIKLIALAIVELRESEDIRQASQSVENSIKFFF